jgi:hypothetical protein
VASTPGSRPRRALRRHDRTVERVGHLTRRERGGAGIRVDVGEKLEDAVVRLAVHGGLCLVGRHTLRVQRGGISVAMIVPEIPGPGSREVLENPQRNPPYSKVRWFH